MCCGDLSFNTSVLRQHYTQLLVAAQNKRCIMKENVKKSSQNCSLSLNFVIIFALNGILCS